MRKVNRVFRKLFSELHIFAQKICMRYRWNPYYRCTYRSYLNLKSLSSCRPILVQVFIATPYIIIIYRGVLLYQRLGTNARKVISEVYTFFVLLCTVFERKSKHMSPDMESIFTKKSMKYSGHRKLLCKLSKLSIFNAFNPLGY